MSSCQKVALRRNARLGAHASGDVFGDLFIQVEANLIAQLLGEPIATKSVRSASTLAGATAFACTPYVDSTTRLIAPDRRLQVAASFPTAPGRGGQRVKLACLPVSVSAHLALIHASVRAGAKRIRANLAGLGHFVGDLLIRLAIAQPCFGSSETVLRISRSSVPCTRSVGLPIL